MCKDIALMASGHSKKPVNPVNPVNPVDPVNKQIQWECLHSKELLTSRVFRLREDRLRLPDGRVMPSYFVFEFPDWVNVLPITVEREVVLVEQYRHAIGTYTLEIPGGSTDPGSGESPEEAARRELLEETGFSCESLRLLALQAPNPALQNNFAHTYLGFDCVKTAELQLDPFEEIRVVTKPLAEVYQLIMNGEIHHSIIVAAFLYALPHLGFNFAGLK